MYLNVLTHPFPPRRSSDLAFHQRLAGRDDLDDARMAGLKVARDAGDQRRRLHRGDQLVEEALLGGYASAARRRFGLGVKGARRAGDVGGLHRRVEIIRDDMNSTGLKRSGAVKDTRV